MKSKILLLLCLLTVFTRAMAEQKATLSGYIRNKADNKALAQVLVSLKGSNKSTYSNKEGFYQMSNIPYGPQQLLFFLPGKQVLEITLLIDSAHKQMDILMTELQGKLADVIVQEEAEQGFGMGRLKAVEGFAIYEGKKNELILLKNVNANLATNNARQLFAKVPGLNIWESDGAGLQLGIGGRGLNPNRSSNFNTRQNGYDMSADALGYPESYYSPPAEALEKIEIVRGASSLQYGTQFGGMLNFIMKKGPADKKVELNSRLSTGSWGLLNSFNSLGGTVWNKKLNYYCFVQYKKGDGWRPHSGFNTVTAYASLHYKINQRLSVYGDYTYMHYLAQQPGGLTDAQFARNPRQSFRARNWFRVNWNLFSLSFDYKLSEHSKFNLRNFALLAGRQSLGNLERINVSDLNGNRTMIDGRYQNIGSEGRFIHHYKLAQRSHTLLLGFRVYQGTTISKQGDANNGSGDDFQFLHPDDLDNSDYRFPNRNLALFCENIFRISSRFTITPGLRYEYISTRSSGYYRYRVYDFAGNIIVDQKIDDGRKRNRDFLLAGLGLSYKLRNHLEFYGNISQNYRAINFNDLRINNPNLKVDSAIKDERGYTADIGFRGHADEYFNFDLSLFHLAYRDKIGLLLKADQPPLYLDYRYRSNIADAHTYGLELFAELDLIRLLKKRKSNWANSVFVNLATMRSTYVNSSDPSIEGREVEYAPAHTFRCGNTLRYKKLQGTLQLAYTSRQFTDASNAIRSSSAVNGIIPAYTVLDFSLRWMHKWLSLEAGSNNLLGARYFTRRADSYPGPGIIPADARSFYLSVGLRL